MLEHKPNVNSNTTFTELGLLSISKYTNYAPYQTWFKSTLSENHLKNSIHESKTELWKCQPSNPERCHKLKNKPIWFIKNYWKLFVRARTQKIIGSANFCPKKWNFETATVAEKRNGICPNRKSVRVESFGMMKKIGFH